TGHDGSIPPTSIDVSAAGIAVAPGTQLALVTGPGTNMLWHYVETDAYGPGRSLISNGALISWEVYREGDFTFRTSIVEGLVKPALVEIEFMPLPVFGVLNSYSATAVGGVGPLSYRWDFDGDGRYETFGQKVEYAFPTLGDHVFGLQITDATGVTTTTSLTVTAVVPEPSTLLLLLCGAAVAVCIRMRRMVNAAGSVRGSTRP
ncbi:MAG: PKD domain-containing protein, partial [Planctomycetota bacterium]|nr:PKD domain-containing protein [Planctomycetota bacterium]